jgi:hypothetical protein
MADRIPEWEIPNAFGLSKLNDAEQQTLLNGIDKALRLLSRSGGPLNIVAGYYAEAIKSENRRRIGYAGKANPDDLPKCILCRGEGYLTEASIK